MLKQVDIADTAGNVVTIQARMPPEQFATALEAARCGSIDLLLLELNILGWHGPELDGVPCTQENIGRFDPDEPLVIRVLKEIDVRNAHKLNLPKRKPE